MKKGSRPQKEIDFEKALDELEAIVRKLDEGTESLERSVELFQRGVELARICKAKLDEAELKVSKLVKEKEGLFREEPFEGEQH